MAFEASFAVEYWGGCAVDAFSGKIAAPLFDVKQRVGVVRMNVDCH